MSFAFSCSLQNSTIRVTGPLLRHYDEYLNISKDIHIYYSKAQLHLNTQNTIKVFEAPRLLAVQMSSRSFGPVVQCYICYQ